MKNEVVEDDDARTLAQPLEDPAVHLDVVPDVVQRDVAARAAVARRNVDLDARAERGHEKCGVVGDARPLWRHRAVVRDPHTDSSSRSSNKSISFNAASLNIRCSRTIGSTYHASSGCSARFAECTIAPRRPGAR